MRVVYHGLRFAAGWLLAHLITLPIMALVYFGRLLEAPGHGIAWLVDDRGWTCWLFGVADRIEAWARRGSTS